MHTECAHCGLKFEREPGFFLGSVYVNYGLTALLMTIFFVSMTLTEALPQQTLLWIALLFCILFPVLFFRHARSLWLGFDQFWDPQGTADEEPLPAPGSERDVE